MKAMVLNEVASMEKNRNPLRLADLPPPEPQEHELLVRISACGVCHTELDEIEGRTEPAFLPIILGHQAVGVVAEVGPEVTRFQPGDRVGVGWINGACGRCDYCLEGRENLCENFRATGCDTHGGYAEYLAVAEDFAFAVPDAFSDAEAAPLLCAGSIGYRSLSLSGIGDGQNLGLTGFGAAGHLVLKLAQHQFPHARIFVFARSQEERQFALDLGALWAGTAEEESPEPLDAVIDTTPAWTPVVEALKNLRPGGRLVINAIRKENADKDRLLMLDFQRHLWREKEIKSVANVTRRDIAEFLALAAEIPIKPEVTTFRLEDANAALQELKAGRARGAKVLLV